ncbi:transcriptional repressor [candidate division WOR-3 bacterium]|nr:transcriptional repressor [candidate division WOR-3 bacterium]
MPAKNKTTRDFIGIILKKSDVPLNASQIREKFSKKPDLATIYRNLDKMENDGSVGVFTAKGRVRLYYSSEGKGGHFIFCRICDRIEKLQFCLFKELKAQIEKKNQFKVIGHYLFIKGICHECLHVFNSKKNRPYRF